MIRIICCFLCTVLLGCASQHVSCADYLNPVKKAEAYHSPIFQKKANPKHKSVTASNQGVAEQVMISPPQASLDNRVYLGEHLERRLPELLEVLEKAPPTSATGFGQKDFHGVPEIPTKVMNRLNLPQDTTISEFDQVYEEAKNLGIISFASAIASVISAAFPLLILPLIITSLVTGRISLKKYDKSFNKKLRALPIIGMVISGVWLALIVLLIAIVIVAFASWGMG